MTAKTGRLPEGHSVALDALRAYPALIVLIAHLYAGVFNSPTKPDAFLVRGSYHLATMVNAAVVVLIVLSGYIVGGSVLNTVRAKAPWRFDIYALNRMTRLWNVLIPALLLTYAVDFAGIQIFGNDGVYGGRTLELVFYPVERFLTAPTLLANISFLGTIRSPSFGTNGALWTVQYEFWFYFLGALLIYGVGRARESSLLVNAARAAAFVVIVAICREQVLRYLSFWLLGAAVSQVPLGSLQRMRGPRRSALLALGVALVVTGLVLGGRWGLRNYDVRLLTAVCTALAMPLLVGLERDQAPGLPGRVTEWLASISFSLYAIHVPLIVFYAAWLEEHGGSWKLTNTSGALLIVPILIAIALARVFAGLTEYRLKDLRRAIRGAAGRLAA